MLRINTIRERSKTTGKKSVFKLAILALFFSNWLTKQSDNSLLGKNGHKNEENQLKPFYLILNAQLPQNCADNMVCVK